MTAPHRLVLDRLRDVVGGPARFRVIWLLSGVLGMAAADQTVAGAVAPDMKVALGVDNTGIGLLVTAASLMSGVTTLPFGLLADRVTRVRLLAGCVFAWSAALAIEGAATSYSMLLFGQLVLGAGVGAATPVVASLAGDLFPNADRGRALGFILTGEFAGAATGLVLAGEISALWSWRGSFWVVAAVGPPLAVVLLRLLPEPARGGGSVVHVGDALLGVGDGVAASPPEDADRDAAVVPGAARSGLAEAIEDAGIVPHEGLVLDSDPAGRSLAWAVRYVLSIRTNVVIILASALGYFYVAGMQTFAIVFVRGRFDVSQSLATLMLVGVGAAVIAGTLASGQVSDRLIGRGHVTSRPLVGGVSLLLAVAFLLPGFGLSSVVVAIPLLLLGAAALGAINPPLDAARLDIMHSRLWGRAESVRNFFQTLLKSGSPLAFGWLSTVLAPPGPADNLAQGGGAVGLTRAFLVLLSVLVVGGLVLLVARRTYPRDVATAMASEAATSR
ncbi:MFS transporter [Segeticoccus rhizosphaerae]|jgi:predicted MFS family arabinose efflux permease|uniref:MFS transporter n=3 Tax=Segeticoccus rhizosphaerae TaxID=1104777 RepID=UPI0010C051FA|nr:MFS transporter [Ornithinicoccus soli]